MNKHFLIILVLLFILFSEKRNKEKFSFKKLHIPKPHEIKKAMYEVKRGFNKAIKINKIKSTFKKIKRALPREREIIQNANRLGKKIRLAGNVIKDTAEDVKEKVEKFARDIATELKDKIIWNDSFISIYCGAWATTVGGLYSFLTTGNPAGAVVLAADSTATAAETVIDATVPSQSGAYIMKTGVSLVKNKGDIKKFGINKIKSNLTKLFFYISYELGNSILEIIKDVADSDTIMDNIRYILKDIKIKIEGVTIEFGRYLKDIIKFAKDLILIVIKQIENIPPNVYWIFSWGMTEIIWQKIDSGKITGFTGEDIVYNMTFYMFTFVLGMLKFDFNLEKAAFGAFQKLSEINFGYSPNLIPAEIMLFMPKKQHHEENIKKIETEYEEFIDSKCKDFLLDTDKNKYIEYPSGDLNNEQLSNYVTKICDKKENTFNDTTNTCFKARMLCVPEFRAKKYGENKKRLEYCKNSILDAEKESYEFKEMLENEARIRYYKTSYQQQNNKISKCLGYDCTTSPNYEYEYNYTTTPNDALYWCYNNQENKFCQNIIDKCSADYKGFNRHPKI